jgi:hypothetical protein
MRFFKKRKASLIREETMPRTIQVQPKPIRPKQMFSKESVRHVKQSPPPGYDQAIKTIGGSNTNYKNQIDSYRTFNGRSYAVVKVDGGTQLVPMRTPSAALFNYQYAYSNYN